VALLFFDTSALVKRYYQEAGTERVDELIDGDDDVVISSLAIIETVSAFRRKYNRDELSRDRMNGLLSEFFEEALANFVVVPVAESIVSFSFELVLEDDLRTLDSLQLAAALSLDTDSRGVRFITADGRLKAVAERRDLRASNPAT